MRTGSLAPGLPPQGWLPRLRELAVSLLLVAASTLAGLLFTPRWGQAPIVLFYLPPVLATAVFYGLGPALFAAVASTLAYDFFFTEPYHTLVIYSPSDAVTVAVLFLVALVTSRLAGTMREQARRAEAAAARNATIAGLAKRLLACAGEREIAEVAVAELSRLFGCNAVLVAGRDPPAWLASAPPGMTLAAGDIAAAAMTLETGDPAGRGIRRVNLADWQFHPVVSAETVIAAVGLARDDGLHPVDETQMPLLANLLDQVALALERARLESQAREFAAVRERDRLRAALLASIGEDVKPRIAAIAAAGRALRRGEAVDKALAAMVASEAAKLDRYVDNLVDLSPGSDRGPLALGEIAVDLHRRSVTRGGAAVHLTPKEYAVFAELAKHAGRVLTHGQLLRAVWGPAHEGQIDYLRVAIRALRQKLEEDPSRPALIVNEPAVGYRLVVGMSETATSDGAGLIPPAI